MKALKDDPESRERRRWYEEMQKPHTDHRAEVERIRRLAYSSFRPHAKDVSTTQIHSTAMITADAKVSSGQEHLHVHPPSHDNRVRSPILKHPYLVPLTDPPHPKVESKESPLDYITSTVVCFPGLGATYSIYHNLANKIRETHPSTMVYGVCLPARMQRYQESLQKVTPTLIVQSVQQELVESELSSPSPKNKLILVGHDFGALLAYEVARSLERDHFHVSGLIVASMRSPFRQTMFNYSHDPHGADDHTIATSDDHHHRHDQTRKRAEKKSSSRKYHSKGEDYEDFDDNGSHASYNTRGNDSRAMTRASSYNSHGHQQYGSGNSRATNEYAAPPKPYYLAQQAFFSADHSHVDSAASHQNTSHQASPTAADAKSGFGRESQAGSYVGSKYGGDLGHGHGHVNTHHTNSLLATALLHNQNAHKPSALQHPPNEHSLQRREHSPSSSPKPHTQIPHDTRGQLTRTASHRSTVSHLTFEEGEDEGYHPNHHADHHSHAVHTRSSGYNLEEQTEQLPPELHSLPAKALLTALFKLGAVPPPLLHERRDMLRRILPVFTQDLGLLQQFFLSFPVIPGVPYHTRMELTEEEDVRDLLEMPPSMFRLHIPVHAIHAENDCWIQAEEVTAWSLTSTSYKHHILEGESALHCHLHTEACQDLITELVTEIQLWCEEEERDEVLV